MDAVSAVQNAQAVAQQAPQALDYMAQGIQASGSVNNVYALISSLVVLAIVLLKELRDNRRFNKSQNCTQEERQSIENRITKIFAILDKTVPELAILQTEHRQFEKQLEVTKQLSEDIKSMNNQIQKMQIDLERLITIQEYAIGLKKKGVDK
jgi:citrate synthase